MIKALYAGTFDPLTNGHVDVIKRAASIVDELTILVADNNLKSHRFTVEERILMIKNILIENKGREGEALATVNYLHHFIENLNAIKELKYILGYFSKNYGYTDPNKFAFDENNQYILESIMYSAMTLYSNGGASRTKLTESHKKWENMLASKKEEKLSRTQELNTAKIQALRELGYSKIDEKNASEVLDKIAEIMAQKF